MIGLCVSTKNGSKPADVAGAVFTFLVALIYAMFIECPAVVYCSELFPGQWRAWGVSTSISISFVGQLIFVAAAPTALRTIGALFYVVFIVLTAIQIVIAIFYFPDVSFRWKDFPLVIVTDLNIQTKGFTLEQMSAVFGDAVVDMHGTVEKASEFLKARPEVDNLNAEVDLVAVEAPGKV